MTLVPELRDQIHATAQRRVGAAGPIRRPVRSWQRLTGSLMLAASVLVVAGVLAVILSDAHSVTNATGPVAGQPPGAPPPAWGQLNAKALARVQQQDAVCRPQRLTSAAPFRHDAPGHDLASVFGVLRRPAPADQRVSARVLRRLSGGAVGQFARGIYLRYVRRGQRNGITYYFIPAADVTQVRAAPDRCYREQLNAFRQLAAHRRASERATLTRFETLSLQQAQTIAEHPAGVCLARVGAGGSGTGPCVNAASIRTFAGRLGVGSDGNDHATVTALIVPDRVATVTAHYSPQRYPGRVPRPLNVTEHAVQNLVIFDLRGAWDPPNSIIYRSATGSVLWSDTRP